MRRLIILLGIASLATLVPAAPAAADFHAPCNPTGSAGVGMSHSGGTFNYLGFVECGTATRIEITSLVLTRPNGSQDAGNAPVSCGPCDSLQANGDDPAGPAGTYTVQMRFNVQVAGQTFNNRVRQQNFTWDGTTLTPVGPPPPPPPALGLCDATPPGSATVGFENLAPSPPASPQYRWSGAVVCHGVDEIQIQELSVQRFSFAGNGPKRQANVSAAHCLGCSTLSAQGVSTSEGPGTYRVIMRYAVRKGTDTRGTTVSRDFNSLGIGPILP